MFRLRGIGRNAKGWLLSGIGLAVLLSALGVGLFIATNGGSSRTAAGDTTKSLAAQDAENSRLIIDGRLVFPREAELTFGVGGTVGEVLVTAGQDVKAGQVLAKLEDLRLNDLEQKAALASLDLRRAQQALDAARISGPVSLTEADAGVAQAALVTDQAARKPCMTC